MSSPSRFAEWCLRRLLPGAGLMSIFGAIAIVIGAAGIYGVMASVVVQQRREMGLRVALGATTARIVSGVMRQAARYLGVGLVLGLAASFKTRPVSGDRDPPLAPGGLLNEHAKLGGHRLNLPTASLARGDVTRPRLAGARR